MAESYFGTYRYDPEYEVYAGFSDNLEYEKTRLKRFIGEYIVKVLLVEKNVIPIVEEKTIQSDALASGLGRKPHFLAEYQIRVDFIEKEKWDATVFQSRR